MNSTSIYYILCRKETKLFVICTATGGLLQIFCRRYIKNHPEFLEEPKITLTVEDPSGKIEQISNEITKDPIIRRIIKRLRGGQLGEKIAELLLKALFKRFVKECAKIGLEAGFYLGLGVVTAITPKKALAKIISNSLPQSLLDKKSFVKMNGEKIYLENCDDAFRYMAAVLLDTKIPYSEKKEFVMSLLRINLDKTTAQELVLCLIPILLLLSTENLSSYFLLLRNLIQAIKEGRISKKLARLIVRKLVKKGIMVDPELTDLIK